MSKNVNMLYKCLECEVEIIGNPNKIDGTRCKECDGHLVLLYYVGIDLGKGEDRTVCIPRGSQV